MPRPAELVKKVFLTSSQTRPTALGSRLKGLRLAAAHSLRSHVCEPSLPSTGRKTCGSAGRKCPHTTSKPLRIHKVFSAAISLSASISAPAELLRIGQPWIFEGFLFFWTQAHLSPAKDKRAKSTEKTYLSDVCALVNRRFPLRIQNIPSPMEAGCCFFIRVWRSRDRRRGNIPW